MGGAAESFNQAVQIALTASLGPGDLIKPQRALQTPRVMRTPGFDCASILDKLLQEIGQARM